MAGCVEYYDDAVNHVNCDDDPVGDGDDNFDGDEDDRLWPDASLDMIMMVMTMNINNQLYVLRSHKCHNDPASTQEDESKHDGVWGVDRSHVGRMVSRSSSEDDNVFGIKCFRYPLHRYGHLEVVQQLVAAPGINMDQLNQVDLCQRRG